MSPSVSSRAVLAVHHAGAGRSRSSLTCEAVIVGVLTAFSWVFSSVVASAAFFARGLRAASWASPSASARRRRWPRPARTRRARPARRRPGRPRRPRRRPCPRPAAARPRRRRRPRPRRSRLVGRGVGASARRPARPQARRRRRPRPRRPRRPAARLGGRRGLGRRRSRLGGGGRRPRRASAACGLGGRGGVTLGLGARRPPRPPRWPAPRPRGAARSSASLRACSSASWRARSSSARKRRAALRRRRRRSPA